MTLADFNALPEPSVDEQLAACLPVPRWVTAVRDSRPYAGWPGLEATASAAAALVETAKIAGYRFDDLVADANPIHSARTRSLESP
jgi:hypothetical protein